MAFDKLYDIIIKLVEGAAMLRTFRVHYTSAQGNKRKEHVRDNVPARNVEELWRKAEKRMPKEHDCRIESIWWGDGVIWRDDIGWFTLNFPRGLDFPPGIF